MTTIRVLPTQNGKFGPLNGPFILSIADPPNGREDPTEAEILAHIIGLIRTIIAGVSSYNSNGMEASSNFTSYAGECLAEFEAEAPEAASRLQNLTIDCTALPEEIRLHPIWRLDRAILAMLPGVSILE
jgi:hypothetical protein